jgi:hypothetical protein
LSSKPLTALEAFAAGREQARSRMADAPADSFSASPEGDPAVGRIAPAAAPAAGSRADLARRYDDAVRTFRLWLTLFWVDLGLGLMTFLLLLNKTRQTSEPALRYSRRTQEQLGEWSMALAVMFLLGIVLLTLMLIARGKRQQQQDLYASALVQELAAARERGEVAAEVECESELRRLRR